VCVCVCVCVCVLYRGGEGSVVWCVSQKSRRCSAVWCVHRGQWRRRWSGVQCGVCTEEEKMQCGVVCFTVEEKVHCSVVWCGVCTDRKQVECRVRKIPESSPTLKVMATLFGDSVLKEFALKPVLTTFCSRPLYAVLEAWPS